MAEEQQAQQPEETKQCSVCGLVNRVGVYYGVQVCHGCRLLFRESCRNLRYTGLCEKPGECQLHRTEDEPRACRDCRLIKCLELGMDPKYKQQGKKHFLEVERRSFDPKNRDEIINILKACQDGFEFPKASEETKQCLVCASVKNVGVRYGVQVCDGCRMLFRDSCCNLRYTGLCEKPGECQLHRTEDELRACRDCRLIKCLYLGMDPKYKQQGKRHFLEVERRSFDPKNRDEIINILKACQDGFRFPKASVTWQHQESLNQQENWQVPSLNPQTSWQPTPYVPQEDEEPETKRGRID